MNLFLILSFLFFIGAVFGWVLELFFRRFISSANPERKWINPGFCVGPYVPLYGFGLCILYLISRFTSGMKVNSVIVKDIIVFLIMAICMTAIEYIAGILSIKCMKVRLWDYSDEKGNIQGIICPKFSLIWAILGALYFFCVHPYIMSALKWLSDNLAFSFVIGMFFGVFVVDVCYSAHLIAKIKQFADENNAIVKYENLKAYIRSIHDKTSERSHFLFAFRSSHTLAEHLNSAKGVIEKLKEKLS